MGDNFEFDKIVLAIALAIFTLILSINLGGFIYVVDRIPIGKGYAVEISEASDSSAFEVKGIPDVIDIAAIMAKADIEAGKKSFNKCAICHSIGKGEPNKVGPNLWGIVGALTAQHADFKYSEAMLKRKSENKIWSFEELYRYLYSPKTYVPGTKMAFAGLKKDDERANVIAYLCTLSDSPLPLPKK